MKKVLIFLGATFLAMATTAASWADDGSVIIACYKKQNGQLRVVASPDDCLPSELPISWNIQGPPGADGINCWDLNANHACDVEDEDKNQDGICDALDCQGPPGPCGTCDEALRISEARIDQPGTDNDEYFELAGPVGSSLAGLTYLVIGDGPSSSMGVIEAVVDLSGNNLSSSGFFVAAEGTFTLGTADMVTDLNFENSDNVTHLLVRGFYGADGDDLDTDDDGALDATPWTEILDCVALIESVASGDLIYCAVTVGPDDVYVPGHAYRCPDGWRIGPFDPASGVDTPGAANPCSP